MFSDRSGAQDLSGGRLPINFTVNLDLISDEQNDTQHSVTLDFDQCCQRVERFK